VPRWPPDILDALGEGKRPKVGRYLVGISAANRAAAGIDDGDEIELTLELDNEPREVDEPFDLKAALDATPPARAGFSRLPFGLRRKHVNDIEAAKTPQTRERRIEGLVNLLR
jgi:uncharacterized protein YdeI (YjbR/CyaY-like superfamily)